MKLNYWNPDKNIHVRYLQKVTVLKDVKQVLFKSRTFLRVDNLLLVVENFSLQTHFLHRYFT